MNFEPAEWLGRTEMAEDRPGAAALASLEGLLDRDPALPADGAPLPPLAHWLCFLPRPRQSEIGPDGHPKRGGFLPPIALPRRMWAGGDLTFHRPIHIGERVRRVSGIESIEEKQGRSGTLVLLTLLHEISGEHGLAIAERQDLVYRDAPQPGASAAEPGKAPEDAAWTREIAPDPVLLFRYSALTLNGHRIHYDQPYATGVEGYPGLVVHGPLLATLLADHFRRHLPDARLSRFSFRATAPVFDTAPFAVCGKPGEPGQVRLWIAGPGNALCMDATATFSEA
ncbi:MULTISPECIES: MaoC family dehydratase N-terminal domain-containing protein [Rhodomicrobium]|uniref:FAS1-like dehydratase domain-containing protein n=1 Tax=Rhodomicrobium TaxID=1068 RepID=UPI000B4AC7BB|nr:MULTISPECIES: MaoC family dehydratase N-terminal domain-containing protein [Rhodomicrobium]